jgi:peptidyl-prolyl cis-trans isomerase C
MAANRKIAAALALILIVSVGCAKRPEKASSDKDIKQPKILAKVNGVPITEDDLAFQISKAHGEPAQSKGRDLEQVIKEELMYQQGLKLGIDKEPSYRAKIAELEMQLNNMKRLEITRRVFNSQVASKVNIGDKEVKDYYAKNADKIGTDLHLGMISYNSKEAAEKALARIKGGESFEKIAAEKAGPAATGGNKPWDMGYATWEQIPIDFVDGVYRLKPGQVSDVVSMKDTGFYLFKLFESRKNPKADLASMTPVIMNRFRDQKVTEAYADYAKQLRKDAKVELLN